MEIMKWVVNYVKRNRWLYYISLVIFMVISVGLILINALKGTEPLYEVLGNLSWNNQWNWFCLWTSTVTALVYIWFYYIPVVYTELNRLKGAFDNERYQHLYKKYRGWMKQFNLGNPGISRKLKLVYIFLWGVFLIAFLIFMWLISAILDFELILTILFEIQFGFVIILNFSGFYICIVFVYFLIRVYRMEQNEKLCYIVEIPSTTYGFQILNNTANKIYLYVSFQSMFCTVTYFCFWKIICADMCWVSGVSWMVVVLFLYVAFFCIIFGLVVWLAIILSSRIYLYKLHEEWKLRSSKVFEKEYQKNINDQDRIEYIVLIKERLMQDKVSIKKWDMIISLAALAANLVTVWSILDM